MIGCMSRGSLRTTAMQFYRLTLRSVALFYVGVRWKFSCSTEIREIYEKWPCGSLPQDNGRNSLSSSSAGCQSSLTLEEIPGHSAKTRCDGDCVSLAYMVCVERCKVVHVPCCGAISLGSWCSHQSFSCCCLLLNPCGRRCSPIAPELTCS